MKTKRELMMALLEKVDLHNQEAHVAMGLILGKSWEQMQVMYGSSLSPCLYSLRLKGVVVRVESKKWEVVPNPRKWVALTEEESAEVIQIPTAMNTEKEATLEMMAQLEKQLNELKKKVG